MDDYILERTAMPEENIRKAQGETVFEEERPVVCTFLTRNTMHCRSNAMQTGRKG